jgi:dipeptidyl aminopeptidase/acylaminoacyl peptidase
MRRLLTLIATFVVLAAATVTLVPPGAVQAGGDAKPSIQQFLKIRTPRQPVPLPDGSLLVIDRPDGIFQLYRDVPKQAGSDQALRPGNVTRTKLTDYPDGLAAFSVSRDGKWAVLMHARGGNENTQLTLFDLAGGPSATTPILANPAVQAAVNLWLLDGSGIIYSANDESPTDFYLYRWDMASRKATKLLGREGTWWANDVSRDGKRVLITHPTSASDVQCYELDVTTGNLTDITIRPEGGTAACEIVGYMPDERSVLMQSDYKDGRTRLYLRDLKKGTVREPIAPLGAFELDGASISDTREMMVAVTNEDGYGVPHMYALPGFMPLPAPTEEKGVISGSSFRGRTLVWALSNARRPSMSFATTYAADSKSAPSTSQLTWTDDQGIDFGAFRLPELVKYKAFDGHEIPAFMYLPADYSKGTPIPFVVIYHGGPEGQHRPGFDPVTQYLLTRGYGVLLPNVRGSTGYGREYQMLDDYKKRWDSVRDGVDAAEWLVKNGYAAPGRLATYGGSYGGFMSVACVVEDAERLERGERQGRLFGACVDVVGIVNMKTFLEKTSGYRRKLREVEYGPLTDPDFLATISSIQRVDKIKVPVFVAHGFNDPRVPVQEAMQLATALKEKGQNPRLFVAPDEGHGFAKLDNRIYFYERMAQFLDETIGKPEASATSN